MEADDEAVRHVFGMALRHLRKESGLSLRGLAAQARYDYTRLSRAERGEHLPAAEWVHGVDAALKAGGMLIFLRALAPAGQAASQRRTALPFAGLRNDDGHSDTVALQMQTPDGRTVQVTLSRRQLAELMASGLLRAILPAGTADPDQADRVAKVLAGDHTVDTRVLAYFNRLLTEHFTADKMMGPRQLLGTALAQLRVIDQLRRTAPAGQAEPVLRTLAQYGEFVGWLYQDLGDTAAARHWTDRATQWAQSTGDYATVAYLMVRRSNIALLDNDAREVVELAGAARKVPGPLCARLQALAAQQEGRGWAVMGDSTSFERTVEQARKLLGDNPDDVDPVSPVYLRQYTLDVLEEQAAGGYRACGQAAEAVRIFETKIAATDDSLRRDQGHLLAKLAGAVLATDHPEPERAISLGMQSAATAHLTGSARIRNELRSVDAVLATRFPAAAGRREFRDAVTALR
jgi:hypothetical protein